MKIFWTKEKQPILEFNKELSFLSLSSLVPQKQNQNFKTRKKWALNFLYDLEIWLVDLRLWQKALEMAKHGTKENSIKFDFVDNDLRFFGILDESDGLDWKRAGEICQFVVDMQHQGVKPQPEKFQGLLKQGMSINQIREAFTEFPDQESFEKGPGKKSTGRFSWHIARAGLFPGQETMTSQNHDWVHGWFRSIPKNDPEFKNHNNWITDLTQLGVVDPAKQEINDERMEQCLVFIKTQMDQKPDYFKLLKHLRVLDKPKIEQAQKQKLAQVRQIKARRKKSKASRKRNRKK